MSAPKIIQSNVEGTRMGPREDLSSKAFWLVGDNPITYGWAYSKATDGETFDVLHAPEGTVLTGDIVQITRSTTDGRGNLVHYTEQAFQPHDGQVSRKDAAKWSKDNWIKIFGDDTHYYNDVESVTYKDPKSKTGKLRTDKCHSISIQHEINVIVWRKNGKRPTMVIPIENIVERHLKEY